MALVRQFPFLEQRIIDGEFSLSALNRLARFAKGPKAEALLFECVGKSVRDVEAVLMKYFPKEDVKEKVGKSRLGEDRFGIEFTADGEFVQDLEKATALLSHRYPQGKIASVLGLALKTLIKELERKPRQRTPVAVEVAPAVPVKRSRYIPRGRRLDLADRDERQCQHVRPDGKLCGETRFLEVDHIQPYALGGSNKLENLRLLCSAHNALRAELRFGRRRRFAGLAANSGGC